MNDPDPIACSLDAASLRERLDEIEALGAESLIEATREGEGHILRFRSGPRTAERLAAIVAAESRCCAFLDLELARRGDELILTIGSSPGGEEIADALAASFLEVRLARVQSSNRRNR